MGGPTDDTGGSPGGAGPGESGPAEGGMAGESVESQLRGLRAEVELLRDVVADAMHPTDSDAGGGQAEPAAGRFEPLYTSVEAWVVGYFTPMYARATSPTLRWCAQWWDHGEAINRLEALWRSFEAARLDALRGMALWYRDFCDPQLAVLTAPTGPFAQCTPDRHAATTALPTVPAPEGHWDDAVELGGGPPPDPTPYP